MMHTATRYPLILFILLGMLLPAHSLAQAEDVAASADDMQLQETIHTLHSLIELRAELKRDIRELGEQLAATDTEAEKHAIQAQLDKLEADLETTTRNLRGIGAGADIASLRAVEEVPFSLQEELFALIKPALKEMKDMTSHVRKKSELKDKIDYYREKRPVGRYMSVRTCSDYLEPTETESRFRPFARRRRRMSRPPLVFMRDRKPCLRFRRIRLG